MAFSQKNIPFVYIVIFFNAMIHVISFDRNGPSMPPTVTRLTDRFSHLSYNHGFTEYFGGSNIQQVKNGSYVILTLNKTSGSGFQSENEYNHGFFSAAIKLPPGYTSGVVVAFYMSNSNLYPHNHDEIDIELLGHQKKKNWVLQTNIYGNGSVRTGREEKFYLWFDPTEEFHTYSIIWNNQHIVFLVDDIPVREASKTSAFASIYPSKPMSIYATIWDGSEWATRGGKYPVNYNYAPFLASFTEIVMDGCKLETTNSNSSANSVAQFCTKGGVSNLDPVDGDEFTSLSNQQIMAMNWARNKFMFYSYCKDLSRFKSVPTECKKG